LVEREKNNLEWALNGRHTCSAHFFANYFTLQDNPDLWPERRKCAARQAAGRPLTLIIGSGIATSNRGDEGRRIAPASAVPAQGARNFHWVALAGFRSKD
jgi:hypothetical protein